MTVSDYEPPAYDLQQSIWMLQVPTTPFGLACSQDVFKHRMDQILEVEEAVSTADNITVHGQTEEHDTCIHHLMQTALIMVLCSMQTNVTESRECCSLDPPHSQWSTLDPDNVVAIAAMLAPTSIKETQEYCNV